MSDGGHDPLGEIEERVGHPQELWDALQERIQGGPISQFADIRDDWLSLMWSIDAYRIAGIPPRGMGRAEVSPRRRLEAVYRNKGNWFATLLSLLLQNRTSQPIRPRTRVQGFSQPHQVDLAWPSRLVDPLVCVETKVTGAPAYGDTPSRSALADFSNRRKEVKFAATDLKLFRRQQDTSIEHWGVWRASAPPKAYFLWGARLRADERGHDDVGQLVHEAQALINTYLDGAGLVSWRERADREGYESVPLPHGGQVTELDDVLYRIATEIRNLAGPEGQVPPPVEPQSRAVRTERLAADTDTDDD